MSTERTQLLGRLAQQVLALPAAAPLRVAVDGVDGAGKTVFADELAGALQRSGRQVLRASVDGFHRPRTQRYARGRDSPIGFYEDSYDHDQFRAELLDPLDPGGARWVRTAVHDVAADLPLALPAEHVDDDAILVVDGIFLHRPELRGYWHYSMWLEVPFGITYARMARRDGCDPDPDAPTNQRYLEGQRLYLARCRPREFATVVVDNSDLLRPRLCVGLAGGGEHPP